MDTGMFTPEMIAPCGLDCSVCELAHDKANPCPGCLGPDENKPSFCSKECSVILCEKRKEKGYAYCDECPDYPCEEIKEKEKRYGSRYPLCESPMKNLRDIRELGMEMFLENERKQWTCKECGGVISVHSGACTACGKQYGVQVIQVNEDTWRIEDNGVRFFLLAGTEKAMLIDSGMNVRNAREIAESLTDLPVSLLNTHADRDHTGSNEEFESFYMHPADEPLYRSSGKSGQVIPLQDGEELDLGNRRLRIIHLPGHTPGSVAVLDVSRRVLISGDPIQEHGRIFMFGQHRNMHDYIESLERLDTMTSDFDEIWPSHSDIPVYPGCIRKLYEGAKKILDHEVPGKRVERFGMSIVVYDLGFTGFLCEE